MPTIKTIELEMSAQPKPGYTEVKQNDADGVQLKLSLKNSDGTAYLIPEGATVSFLAVKSDQKSVVISSTDSNPRVTYTSNGNTVFVTLSAQVLAVAGIILCNAIVSKDGATTSTQTFTLSCAEALTADDLTSSSEFQSLSMLLADLTARQAEFDAVNDKIANMALGYGGTFVTLAELQADSTANTPDGKKRFYIVVADGHYYYWSNISSAWTDGGAIIPYADVIDLKNRMTNAENAITEHTTNITKVNGQLGYGARNGGLMVTPTSPASYAVNVSGDIFDMPDGRSFNISGQVISLEPGDNMNLRIDIIYVSINGELCYLAGEPGAGQPETPEGGILIAVIDAEDGSFPITADKITDVRPISVLHSTAYDETYNNVGERFDNTEEKVLDLQTRTNTAETAIGNHTAQLNTLTAHAALTDSDLAALRAAQAQMSTDTRIDLPGTGKTTLIPKNAAVMGVGGMIKGMTLTNPILNGNMEVDSNSDGLADGFTKYAGATATIVNEGVNGSKAQKLRASSTSSMSVNLTGIPNVYSLPVNQNDKIFIMCHAKKTANQTASGNTYIGINEYNSSNTVLTQTFSSISLTTDLLRKGVIITVANASAVKATFLFFQNALANEVVEYVVDDVVLINLTALGLSTKTAAEMALFCPNYISGTQSVIAMRLRATDANGNTKSACYIEPCVLRRNAGGICDEIDLHTGRMTMRLDSNGNALATPIYKDNVVTGTLVSYPNGSIICEPALADVGIYNNGILILRTGYPIQSIETLCKVNADGTQTPLDASAAIIASGGLSFTHPSLTNGDIVAFTYFTATAGIIGENVFNYVNANGLTLGANGKYYKVGFAIDINGNISLTKTEVV